MNRTTLFWPPIELPGKPICPARYRDGLQKTANKCPIRLMAGSENWDWTMRAKTGAHEAISKAYLDSARHVLNLHLDRDLDHPRCAKVKHPHTSQVGTYAVVSTF